jgi:epoxide hydrolase 4
MPRSYESKVPFWCALSALSVLLGACEPEPSAGPARPTDAATRAGDRGLDAARPLEDASGALDDATAHDAGTWLSDASLRDADTAPPTALPFACARDKWGQNAVNVGELTLNVACRASEGADDPLIVLLHGYPELHLTWNRLAAPLVEHGFALLAPDQRGHNTSDKPAPVEAYAIDRSVSDLHGLIEASGRERVLLIGHDWGGVVSFTYAHRHPERVRGLVVMNGPHPDIWGNPQVDPVQAQASDSYVPALAGPLGGILAPPLLESMLAPHLTPEELAQYRVAWSEPDAFPTMHKWYHANLYPEVKLPRGVTIEVPTLVLWGMDDPFVTSSQLAHMPGYVADVEIVEIPGVDHWITHQKTALLAEHIVAFEARIPRE